MTITQFVDDGGYLAWIDEHPHGFVVNTNRVATPRYLVLHRASCPSITGSPASGRRWKVGYRKVCAEDRTALGAWAGTLGGSPRPCPSCAP